MQQNWLWEEWDFLCHYGGEVLSIIGKIIEFNSENTFCFAVTDNEL